MPESTELFGDQLVRAIEEKAAPVCVGIDPVFEMLPDAEPTEVGRKAAAIEVC